MININSRLLEASRSGDLSEVCDCLQAGADVHSLSDDGSTPIMLAAEAGHVAVVDALLHCSVTSNIDDGPTVDKKNKMGWTALMLASREGHVDCMKILLAAHAPLAEKDAMGWTTLMLASRYGHADCVKILLRAGADPNETTGKGTTALMFAASDGNVGCVRALLDYRADIMCKTRDGLTALDFANRSGEQQCRNLILQHQAKLLQQEAERQPRRSTAPQPTSAPPMPGSNMGAYVSQRQQIEPHPGVAKLSIAFNWKILYEDLTDLVQIGSGSFGNVFAARYHETEVAVKEFKLPIQPNIDSQDSTLPSQATKSIERELELLTALRHPNVVAFMGVVESPLCVVLELLPRGSLHDILSRIRSSNDSSLAAELTWQRRLKILKDVAAGMSHLHARNILHRDLKSPNVLLTNDWSAKVADLGLSKLVEEVGSINEAVASQSTMAAPGNFRWLAPEAIFGSACTAASDVYSFGVILWELLTGKFPWSHDRKFLQNPFLIGMSLQQGQGLPVPQSSEMLGGDLSTTPGFSRYMNLMKQCLSMEPSQRPSFGFIAKELRELWEMQPGTTAIPSPLASPSPAESRSAASSGSCIVCMARPGTAALLHQEDDGKLTSHGGFCKACAELLHRDRKPCPTCRRQIFNTVSRHFG